MIEIYQKILCKTILVFVDLLDSFGNILRIIVCDD